MIRRLLMVAGMAIAAGAAVPALAAEPAQCGLANRFQVTSVKPYQPVQHEGYADITRLRGADLHVAAKPGLTREWLQRTVEDAVAKGDCGLGLRNVTVDVQPAGDAFDVYLSSSDERTAHEILNRAQQLGR